MSEDISGITICQKMSDNTPIFGPLSLSNNILSQKIDFTKINGNGTFYMTLIVTYLGYLIH